MRRTDARDGMAYGTRAVGKMRLSTCCERTRTTNVTYRGAIQSIRRRHPPSEHIWCKGAQLQSCRISQIRKVFFFLALKWPRNPIKFWNLHADPGISTPTDPLTEPRRSIHALNPIQIIRESRIDSVASASAPWSARGFVSTLFLYESQIRLRKDIYRSVPPRNCRVCPRELCGLSRFPRHTVRFPCGVRRVGRVGTGSLKASLA
jgi:hypothetical protein